MDKDKSNDESLVDILRVQGVNAKGFGSIPKTVMRDCRLSIQAKAIYAYFCSYAGAGSKAFPGRAIILKDLQISKDFYYKSLKQLKDLDYVQVYQEQGKRGKYGRNIYTLVQCPVGSNNDSSPCPATQDTVEAPCPTSPDTVGQDTNSIRYKKDIDISINHEYIEIDTDMMDRMDGYIQIVKENIEYDTLLDQEPNKGLVKNIFTLIIDTLCGESGTFQIGGVPMPAQQVKKRFLELDQKDVSSVILGIAKLDKPIRNARNYLMTALYNAPATSQAKWTSEINSAIRQYNEKKRNV